MTKESASVEIQSEAFKGSELQLPYSEWERLAAERRSHLDPSVQEWLFAWSMYDLWNSPMRDEVRAQRRYGHYVGWFDARDLRGE